MALGTSPVMQQYAKAKSAHPDALVMMRMGDFYEMLGDDAVQASEILQITLTKRRTSKEGDEGIPMCGVPYHAAEGYIGKLIASGVRVALVEQVETPEEAKKARGSSAIVKREVVRLFTPGTLTDEAYLAGNTAKYLVTVSGAKDSREGAVAWMDMSTGDVGVRVVTQANASAVLAALPVGELVVADSVDEAWVAGIPRRLVSVQGGLFARSTAEAAVKRAYAIGDLAGLGLPSDGAACALGALIGYAELTQVGKLPSLRMPNVVSGRTRMSIDPSTRKNLELTESLGGRRADSLLGVLDRCMTGAGARLLARWVAEPLVDVSEILRRQDAVAGLSDSATRRTEVRELLKQTGDIARCVSRLLLGRGGPRDLGTLRATGDVLPALRKALAGCDGLLKVQADGMSGLEDLTALLDRALAEEPLPALIRDGGFIASGYDSELDGYRVLVTDGNALLQALEERETAASGIPLKLRYNQVWGYYLEITKQHESKVPGHWLHRQTTTNSHRYSTAELMSLERELGSAGAKAQKREEDLLAALVDAVRKASYPLLAASEALATLDVLASMAEVAARHGWVRPVVEDSNAFSIDAGCHPVVASKVAEFVPNGCDLSGGQMWLLTGPNMAGKSTFLRQNALLCILAQMGSSVPAKAARIGVADAVFSRIGAADDLAAGQSTFMVEMVETAQILNRATARSLVILDELGRGTATYDGLAIAWACVEDIVGRLGCRTLFATHYHELTSLEAQMEHVSCWQVAVREWKGEIVFLHEVKRGAAAGSYGVQVAKLAGVPQQVVTRADGLLEGFMKVARNKGVVRVDELSLFAHVGPQDTGHRTQGVIEERLKGLDVDGLSAREALDELYKLRGLVN